MDPIEYPDCDGRPIAEDTLHFDWIVRIEQNLEALLFDDPNVFVAGDLLWYPVEGEPTICTAPDAVVAFGRPKGRRGSYKQWKEGNIAPQVVFEVLPTVDRFHETLRKFQSSSASTKTTRDGIRTISRVSMSSSVVTRRCRLGDGASRRPSFEVSRWIGQGSNRLLASAEPARAARLEPMERSA